MCVSLRRGGQIGCTASQVRARSDGLSCVELVTEVTSSRILFWPIFARVVGRASQVQTHSDRGDRTADGLPV